VNIKHPETWLRASSTLKTEIHGAVPSRRTATEERVDDHPSKAQPLRSCSTVSFLLLSLSPNPMFLTCRCMCCCCDATMRTKLRCRCPSLSPLVTWHIIVVAVVSCYKMSYRPTCNALGDVGFMGLRCRNEVRLLHHTPQGGTKQTSIAHCFLRLNVLDKLVEFPYCPIRYCCHDQVAPPKLGSGILTGAIISASRICNNFRDLQTQTIKVVYRLIERGHKRDQLMSAARNAVKSIYGDHDLYNRRLMSTIGYRRPRVHTQGGTDLPGRRRQGPASRRGPQ
jgi:hypothetical protein